MHELMQLAQSVQLRLGCFSHLTLETSSQAIHSFVWIMAETQTAHFCHTEVIKGLVIKLYFIKGDLFNEICVEKIWKTKTLDLIEG